MKLPAHALAITGMGIYTSLGCGLAENWHHLINGHSGVRTITRFPTTHLPTTIAATLNLDSDGIKRTHIIVDEVLQQALIQSQLPADVYADSQLVIALAPMMEILWSERMAAHRKSTG